jgi:hypothetical protein
MAEIVQSLFGVTPEMYQQNQQQRADAQALRYAELTPFQQANFAIGRGANMLGGAIGGALGGQDPELQRISMRQQIARQLNPNDPASIEQAIAALSQGGDPQGAMMLQGEYRKLQESNALVGQRTAAQLASQAQASKIQLGVEQENKLRGELSNLGPNATEEQIRGVLLKYGDPDKVLTALTSAATRAEDRASRERLAKDAADARVEAARIQAEARVDAARQAGATQLQIAQLKAQNSRDLAALAASLKGPKVLPSALQKEEDKDLELVDSLKLRTETLQPAVTSLTVDPKTNKAPLELGPLKNTRYQAQNASGNSTEESRAFAALQRAVQEATNLKTDAAKGVQTDKDVLRFANELTAAFGKFDTKTTLDALNNFVTATNKARTSAEKRIESRRKSQGIEPYGLATGTAQNPIKLD